MDMYYFIQCLYIYIIEDTVDNPVNYLLFPYFIFISFTIFWLLKDNKYVYPKPDSISLDDSPHFYYSLFIAIFCLILTVWIIAFSRIKKDFHSYRFNYYLVVNIYAMISFILYILFVNFDTPFTSSTAVSVFPICTLALYALLMANGQYDTDENTDGARLFIKGTNDEYNDNGIIEP